MNMLVARYRKVQLNFTPDIRLFNFRSKIQLDHPVYN